MKAQVSYDSISISRFLIREDSYGENWNDTLDAGRYPAFLSEQKTVWRKPAKQPNRAMGVKDPILAITESIKRNGTEDIAKCFIPRHSINYYRGGKIVQFLQVCFECDGLRFSDDTAEPFVKSVRTREKQMQELKRIFKDLL